MKKAINKTKKCSIVINTSFDRELYNTVALINSIKDFSKSSNLYTIYVLFYDKTKEYVKNILASMQTDNIKIVCIMDFYEEYPDLPQVSKKLLSIFAPKLVKENTNIVLLSPNTIVQCDIADILDINLDDKVAACSYDLYDKVIKNNGEKAYFNTDVAVINVAEWKHLKITEDCLSYIQRKGELSFVSLINILCCDNIQELGIEWNFQYWNTKKEFFETTILKNHKAKVINFVDDKPWIRPMMDKADIWWKYVRNNPLYEIILYRNIYPKLSDSGYSIIPDKKAERSVNIDYIFLDKLKSELKNPLFGKRKDQDVLNKILDNKDVFALIKRYIWLSFKYMLLRSKREDIKNEMEQIYNDILSIISGSQN